VRIWFNKPGPERGVDQSRTDEDVREQPNAFRLEALEPRVLLSADPISGEFARVIQDAADDDEDLAVIVQDISDVAELHADTLSTESDSDVDFAWPEGWDDTDDGADEDSNAAAIPDDSPEHQASVSDLWHEKGHAGVHESGDNDSSSVSSATELRP
jgi:hypothetical protein